jgi:hypothetical protein
MCLKAQYSKMWEILHEIVFMLLVMQSSSNVYVFFLVGYLTTLSVSRLYGVGWCNKGK